MKHAKEILEAVKLNKLQNIMKLPKPFLILIVFFTFSQLCLGQKKTVDTACQIDYKLKFEKVGVLFLLVEPENFKPIKLRTMFLCLAKKRSNLEFIHIIALSDEDELEKNINSFKKDLTTFPQPPPYIAYPKGWKPPQAAPPNYYRGYYYRYKNEYFEYSPDPKKWELTKVVLKKKEIK